MKLWVQVLFAQGYLWRDRLPQRPPEDCLMHVGHPSLFMFFVGLLFFIASLFYLIGGVTSLEAISGSLVLALGIGYVGENIGYRAQALGGSKAFWVSLSWASGFFVRAAIIGLIATSLLDLAWIRLAIWLVLAIPHTPGINAIERRFLFFADPVRNSQMLIEEWRGLRNLIVDTYWRFPKQMLLGGEVR